MKDQYDKRMLTGLMALTLCSWCSDDWNREYQRRYRKLKYNPRNLMICPMKDNPFSGAS